MAPKVSDVFEQLTGSTTVAANLNARADLLDQITHVIHSNDWTQAQAAVHCGVSQPRLNDLLRGKLSGFSLDALVNIAAHLGLKVQIALEAA